VKKHEKKIVVEKEIKMRNEEARNWAKSDDNAQGKAGILDRVTYF